MNELQVYEVGAPATVDTFRVKTVLERMAQIKTIMDNVMQEDVHYGKIPGCPKPSLYLPGAEKLATTFQLATHTDAQDLSTPGEVRYRVRCVVTSMDTGALICDEMGEASSSEEKYAWRRAVCDQEYDATDPMLRREKWAKGGNGPYSTKQIRTNPADSANTILRMASKRAKVAAVRAALAASDIFDIGIEDLPDDLREEYFGTTATDKPKVSAAMNKRQNPGTATQGAKTYSIQSGVTVIPFGKHKGQRICDVPEDYVAWLAEKSTSPEIKEAANNFLHGEMPPQSDTADGRPDGDTPPPPADYSDPFADE